MENSSMKDRNPRLVILASAFAAFLATFNETYLNIAFTPIMEDTGVGVNTVQWLATMYMLGAAVMVPVSAFAYRSINTRLLFCSTTAMLVIGSVIGALAPSFQVLLAGRIVQALGTGMLIPIGMNITLEVAPREKLGSYMGIMGAMTTLGPSLSVILSGAILSVFNWHMLLWIFAGLSLALFLIGAVVLVDIAQLTHPKLDAASVALIGLAMLGTLYGISSIFGGSIPVAAGTIAVGLICLALFIRRQGRLAEPLIDIELLKVRPFALAVVINMISLITIFSMNIIMPIYMQSNMGASSMMASLTMFPAIVLCCFISPVAGRVYDKHGARFLLPTGFALIFIFTILLALFRTFGSLPLFAILYIPVICGSALIIGPVQSFGLSFLAPRQNPHGVTLMSTGFQIAGCIGSSVFTGVYYLGITRSVMSGVDEAAAASSGFSIATLLASAFALAGVLISLREVRFKREKDAHDGWEDDQTGSELSSIMKRDVYTLKGEITLIEALRFLTDKKISGVPVVDDRGELTGFISDGDILNLMARLHPVYESAYSIAFAVAQDGSLKKRTKELFNMKVKDAAVKKVITVDVDDSLEEVCRVLHEFKLKKAPVMDGGRMVGVINRSNVMKYIVQTASESI